MPFIASLIPTFVGYNDMADAKAMLETIPKRQDFWIEEAQKTLIFCRKVKQLFNEGTGEDKKLILNVLQMNRRIEQESGVFLLIEQVRSSPNASSVQTVSGRYRLALQQCQFLPHRWMPDTVHSEPSIVPPALEEVRAAVKI